MFILGLQTKPWFPQLAHVNSLASLATSSSWCVSILSLAFPDFHLSKSSKGKVRSSETKVNSSHVPFPEETYLGLACDWGKADTGAFPLGIEFLFYIGVYIESDNLLFPHAGVSSANCVTFFIYVMSAKWIFVRDCCISSFWQEINQYTILFKFGFASHTWVQGQF